jgi:NADPH:quinone reductase-like Zn-dependent oxidoreductase
VGDKVISLFFPDWHEGHPTAETTRRLSGDSTDGFACRYSVVAPASLTAMPTGWSYRGAATLSQSITAARIDANVVLVGMLSGPPAEIDLMQWMLRQQRIRPIAVGSRATQIEIVKFLQTSAIQPVIDSYFALANLADAFRYQLSRKHFGKIVIDV